MTSCVSSQHTDTPPQTQCQLQTALSLVVVKAYTSGTVTAPTVNTAAVAAAVNVPASYVSAPTVALQTVEIEVVKEAIGDPTSLWAQDAQNTAASRYSVSAMATLLGKDASQMLSATRTVAPLGQLCGVLQDR